MPERVWSEIAAYFTAERVLVLAKVGLILVVGLLVARLASKALGRLLLRSWNRDQTEFVRRACFYTTALLVVAWALNELGFKLGVLLGAAGVASVAIGFASQTYLSNLISGFLLFGERPFKLGDVIEVESVTGEVLAIDMISTKLRTFSNHYVRIPNELMIKSKVVNLTRFAIRRLDLMIPVAYEEDLGRVRAILQDVAENNSLCLQDPPPIFLVRSWDESCVTVQFSVWCQTAKWIAFQEAITIEIQRALAAQRVRYPYPHRVVLRGN